MANNPIMLACPFCGAKAKAKQQDPYPPEQPNVWWTVECSHGTSYYFKRGKGCRAMPMANGDTIEEAVDIWNTRYGLTLEARKQLDCQMCIISVSSRAKTYMRVSPDGKVTWVLNREDATIFPRIEADPISVAIRVICNTTAEIEVANG